MLGVLKDRTYRHLFAAQLVALVGTGLATVALGLLAYDIAGASAGAVLGAAMTIKMVAYVGVSPLVGAVADRLPRRAFLVSTDLLRAGVALCLPFVDSVWQVYVLIFLLQAASASFTPTFQATIPDVLPDERDYTRALSLSRLAYDLESLLSPVLAAALLTLVTYQGLFTATTLGFLASAALVVSVLLPKAAPSGRRDGVWRRITLGARVFLATPRLRALLAMNVVVAAASAVVIVNTVVIVRGVLGRGEVEVAIALGCYGAGSMAVALRLPRLLDRLGDRPVMLPAGFLLTAVLAGAAAIMALAPATAWPLLLFTWLLLGAGTALILTPGGRLLRRSCDQADRPALFAAQFSLSHACFLGTYPLAGWLGAAAGMGTTLLAFAGLTLAAALLAVCAWPAGDPRTLTHVHADLHPGHPHLHDAETVGAGWWGHRHEFVIDRLHTRWPQRETEPVDTR
ncbi:MFS transporter [Allosalinactinospora lopnorensis]|uniref:MFS transporter n=1 Tax=Allosalinactinospora lopnorensis TaxID=1352348 RepID=UPI000623CC10|nr:MFS transporter [Allosalinactinospora lopnorensis]